MRLPLPPAVLQGSLYENQKGMKTRFFDMVAGAMSQPPPMEPIFDRTPHPFGRRPGRSDRL